MKIYISGPVTGTKDYVERFTAAENRLQQGEHTVINPVRVAAELPEEVSHAEYMSLSICLLDMCEGIFLLKDWEISKGATIEFEHAVEEKKVITFEK